MDYHNHIWNLSKMRFLQSTASVWILSNKIFEILLFSGIIMFLYFDIFVFNDFKYLKYFGFIVSVLAAGAISSRLGSYEGYFDGYEQGFIDAATRNCDYWDEEGEFKANIALMQTIGELSDNEKNISEENRQERFKDISKGMNKIYGFVLTWRKVKQ
jgi:hypothetical protein